MNKEITLSDFAYELPPELIAQNPLGERQKSALLVYERQTKQIAHHIFQDILSLLKSTDVLVVNNTQVIPVRLVGKKANGSKVELLLVKKETSQNNLWQAIGPIKKLKVGETVVVSGNKNDHSVMIEDTIVVADQKRFLIRIDGDSDEQTYKLLSDIGKMPLPPYILQARHRAGLSESNQLEMSDAQRYQTVFARYPGAIAAPTAGLHFVTDLISQLQNKGITVAELTLHVGPGTFKPIAIGIEEHVVEPEWFAITQETAKTLNLAKQNGQRIIAVGTTTCRALESAVVGREIKSIDSSYTSLFIKPGYQFKFIDGLITNFHLSQSSLLLLVAALMGRDELMRAYKTAIAHKYRFYSYGDAMIVL